jgi:hypothetical protein
MPPVEAKGSRRRLEGLIATLSRRLAAPYNLAFGPVSRHPFSTRHAGLAHSLQ